MTSLFARFLFALFLLVPPAAFAAEPTQHNAAKGDAPHAGHMADDAPPTPITVESPKPATFPPQNRGVAPPPVAERTGEHVPAGIIMTDERGNKVNVAGLMDRPALIMPVFFTCPAGCNTLQSAMAAALSEVGHAPGKEFRVLSISFDEKDTPEIAARKKSDYMAAMSSIAPTFPADAWLFLTGDHENIKRLMDSLGFPFIRLGPGNFSHPLVTIVTAPEAKISRYLYGQSILPFDLTMALNEAALGKTGISVKRMLAYCFTYDPESRGYVFNFMRVAGLIILFGATVFFVILLFGGKKKWRSSP